MQNIFISGCGDIGIRVAAQIQISASHSSHYRIYAMARQPSQLQRLHALGLTPTAYDLDKGLGDNPLPTQDAVVFHFAPPPAKGQSDSRFRNLLAECERSGLPQKVILLSTTAVYGDCHGEWIDEATPVDPQTDRGKRRLDAELALSQWAHQHKIPYVILRVSGIYGEGRYPIERLMQGMAILREDLSPYSNRIHQDDLATVCVAAVEHGKNGEIYNVCDGQPSTMAHYFKSVAAALGLPAPQELDREQASHQLSEAMLSYLKDSRRISNQKMLQQLHITLRYPDLAAGLAGLRSRH